MDALDDFMVVMANADSEQHGKRVLEDYYAGRISVSKNQAEEIVRKKMDEVLAEDLSHDDIYTGFDFEDIARIKLEAIVDLFMKYSLLRFQCGMSKENFKNMLEEIAAERRELKNTNGFKTL